MYLNNSFLLEKKLHQYYRLQPDTGKSPSRAATNSRPPQDPAKVISDLTKLKEQHEQQLDRKASYSLEAGTNIEVKPSTAHATVADLLCSRAQNQIEISTTLMKQKILTGRPALAKSYCVKEQAKSLNQKRNSHSGFSGGAAKVKGEAPGVKSVTRRKGRSNSDIEYLLATSPNPATSRSEAYEKVCRVEATDIGRQSAAQPLECPSHSSPSRMKASNQIESAYPAHSKPPQALHPETKPCAVSSQITEIRGVSVSSLWGQATKEKKQEVKSPKRKEEAKAEKPDHSAHLIFIQKLQNEHREPPRELVPQPTSPEPQQEPVKLSKSLYDPSHSDYIHRAKRSRKPNWNDQQYTAFVYNGNYPEVVRQALMVRGCWNLLIYNEVAHQCQDSRSKIQHKILDEPEYQPVDESLIDKCHFIWRPCNFYDSVQKKIDRRFSEQVPLIYNHFQSLKEIGTKTGLIRSLRQYYYTNHNALQERYSEFNSTPTTFIIQSRQNDQQLEDLKTRFFQIKKGYAPKEKVPMKHCVHNLWLVKPSNANQGRGIQIFNHWEDILGFVNSKVAGSQFVVQKYIERPLLYKNRKFDIRVWALCTTRNEIYFYKQGYLRTSSCDYKIEEGNAIVHLTNQCLQVKEKSTYGMHEEGNTLSYQVFQAYLDQQYQGKVQVETHIIPRMKDLVIDCFLSVKNVVNVGRRRNHFELFGFDFMIDEDFRVWLIEVNSNPYLGMPNQWAKQAVPRMMDETLRIVLDPTYAPRDSYYESEQFRNRQQNYELIYCEGSVSNLDYLPDDHTDSLCFSQRRGYGLDILYPFKELVNDESASLKGLRYAQGVVPTFSSSATRQLYTSAHVSTLETPKRSSSTKGWNAFYQSSFSRRINYRPSSAVISNKMGSRRPTIAEHEKTYGLNSSQIKGKRHKKTRSSSIIKLKEKGIKAGQTLLKEAQIPNLDLTDVQLESEPFQDDIIMTEPDQAQQVQLPGSHSRSVADVAIPNQDLNLQDHIDLVYGGKQTQISEKKLRPVLEKKEQSNINMRYSVGITTGGGAYPPRHKQMQTMIEKTKINLVQAVEDAMNEMIKPRPIQRSAVIESDCKTSIADFEEAQPDLSEGKSSADSISCGNKTVICEPKDEASPAECVEPDQSSSTAKKQLALQFIDSITSKLDDYLLQPKDKKTYPEFKQILKQICLAYFVEKSQEEEIDAVDLAKMIVKLKMLIQDDLTNQRGQFLMKPDSIDILVELLNNENTFSIQELTTEIFEKLLQISESQYEPAEAKVKQLHLLRKPDPKTCQPLTQSSLVCKNYLLKNQTLKKLIGIHQRILLAPICDSELMFGSKQEKLEQILMNLSCLKEVRESAFAEQVQRLIQSPESEAYAEQIVAYGQYLSLYQKCLKNGLMAYLMTNKCYMATNNRVLTALTVQELTQILNYCQRELSQEEEDQNDKQEKYLKQIQNSIVFANLRARIKLTIREKEMKIQKKVVKKSKSSTKGHHSATLKFKVDKSSGGNPLNTALTNNKSRKLIKANINSFSRQNSNRQNLQSKINTEATIDQLQNTGKFNSGQLKTEPFENKVPEISQKPTTPIRHSKKASVISRNSTSNPNNGSKKGGTPMNKKKKEPMLASQGDLDHYLNTKTHDHSQFTKSLVQKTPKKQSVKMTLSRSKVSIRSGQPAEIRESIPVKAGGGNSKIKHVGANLKQEHMEPASQTNQNTKQNEAVKIETSKVLPKLDSLVAKSTGRIDPQREQIQTKQETEMQPEKRLSFIKNKQVDQAIDHKESDYGSTSSKPKQVKQVQWNEQQNQATIRSNNSSLMMAEYHRAVNQPTKTDNQKQITQVNNSLNLALEKLETMKQKLIEKVQLASQATKHPIN